MFLPSLEIRVELWIGKSGLFLFSRSTELQFQLRGRSSAKKLSPWVAQTELPALEPGKYCQFGWILAVCFAGQQDRQLFLTPMECGSYSCASRDWAPNSM